MAVPGYSTSHKSNFFSLHSALGPISKFSAGNHQEILQISQAGIHFLFPQKEFLNRSIIRSKFCKSKERVLYFHIRSHYFKNQMIINHYELGNS